MFYNCYQKLINLSRLYKTLIQICYDTFAVFCSLILIKTINSSFDLSEHSFLFFCVSLSFPLLSFLFGLYKSFVRFFDTSSLVFTLLITMTTYILIFFIHSDEPLKLYIWVSSFFFTFSLVSLPRLFLRETLGKNVLKNPTKIAILGNGYESYELFEILKRSKKYQPVCFLVEKKKSLFSKNFTYPELNSSQFLKQNSKLQVDIILAPSNKLQKPWVNLLIQSVAVLKIPIFKSNGVDSMVKSQKETFAIAPLSLTDLTLRNPEPPIKKLLERNIHGKTILITGGGGSIGSELCKQIFLQDPKHIIALDSSEYNLYEIEQALITLSSSANSKVKISAVLCSVLNRPLLKKVFQNNKIDNVFHAAAYKHVPILEKNALTGFENNIFGTKNVAELSVEFKVNTFTLVSTDKAVNPTNIMGVTKKLAEMFCQSLSVKNEHTIFAIVRFGNVLGSSGSVIPKFESQIASGGPITVTHQKINRYFMSITEAAQLVIQASAMAKKCKIFVLDMGKPVNILDLAKRLCFIRGLTSYCIDEQTFDGDIEIRITGLRDGEKMYEEVLKDDKTSSTEHPHIFSAQEEFISFNKIILIFDELINSLRTGDGNNLKKIFSTLHQVNYFKKNMLEFCKKINKKVLL